MRSPDETLLLSGIRPISDKEFRLFQDLIRGKTGISLSPAKKAMLVSRLARRLRARGLTSFDAYYRLVSEEDNSERIWMIDAICTNETRFFREPAQFDFLRDQAIPRWIAEAGAGRRPRRVRLWSAGCSTGEEPYSLAMVLLDRLPPGSGWAIEILATDLSTCALEKAGAATWPIARAAEIPPALLRRFMLKGTRTQEGLMRAGPEIRSVVRFARLNLNDDEYCIASPLDAIFCRNVLIYFDAETKQRIVERLLACLAPHGFLFLGHAESLASLSDRVRSVGSTVYVLRETRLPASSPARPIAAARRTQIRLT